MIHQFTVSIVMPSRARENTLTAGRMYIKESNDDRQNPQSTQFNTYLIARMMLVDIRLKHDASCMKLLSGASCFCLKLHASV